jgi:hypothetical protein
MSSTTSTSRSSANLGQTVIQTDLGLSANKPSAPCPTTPDPNVNRNILRLSIPLHLVLGCFLSVLGIGGLVDRKFGSSDTHIYIGLSLITVITSLLLIWHIVLVLLHWRAIHNANDESECLATEENKRYTAFKPTKTDRESQPGTLQRSRRSTTQQNTSPGMAI